MALHFIWKPDAKDYNKHFITNCSQLEENNYFWWKSVWKDCPVKQEGCFAFIALKLWWFTAKSVLFYRRGAKQKETESGHNELFAFQNVWKSIEMVELEGKAVSFGWTVSNCSWVVGMAPWQSLCAAQSCKPQPGQSNEGGTRTEKYGNSVNKGKACAWISTCLERGGVSLSKHNKLQKVFENFSPPLSKIRPSIFWSWNTCELIPLLLRKMFPATPCPSHHTTLAQVGSELFWNLSGALKREKHLKEWQTSSTLSLVLSYEWENTTEVYLQYSQFSPPLWPTSSLGWAQDIKNITLLRKTSCWIILETFPTFSCKSCCCQTRNALLQVC